jgi:hypothetical protein
MLLSVSGQHEGPGNLPNIEIEPRNQPVLEWSVNFLESLEQLPVKNAIHARAAREHAEEQRN